MAKHHYKVGQTVSGITKGYTSEGLGILYTEDNSRFFVKGLIDGEEAEAKITYVGQRSSYAKLTKLITKSDKRIQPKCPVSTACGGCQFQHIAYDEQLKIKRGIVENAFRTIAKSDHPVDECVASPMPYYYRNKMQIPLGLDKKGNIISGFYRARTHIIIPTPECVIENERSNGIIATIRALMKSMRIPPYDEDKRSGVIRHILIRTSYYTPGLMVVLITNADNFYSRNNFVKALTKAHPEITTVVQNVNKRKTSVILGKRFRTLYGPGFIEDDILGIRFKISPQSFFQINPLQTENLYKIAIEKAEINNSHTVLDAYCGIGTISLIAARHAKKVIGVEINSRAIRDARSNANRNNIDNVEFYTADASDFMENEAKLGSKYDVVIMDPPRKGSDEKFLNAVLTLEPNKVVYVSCNPGTLARDITFLNKKYEIKSITPVDMFSQTYHVETVVLIERK